MLDIQYIDRLIGLKLGGDSYSHFLRHLDLFVIFCFDKFCEID